MNDIPIANTELDFANVELEQRVVEALDRCASVGASTDDLRLLAWQCGCRWTPNAPRTSSVV